MGAAERLGPTMKLSIVALILLAAIAGCGDVALPNQKPPDADAGPAGDAGPSTDAGPSADAGVDLDAGPAPDSGPAADSGPDAGPDQDAGPSPDAGPEDAGLPTGYPWRAGPATPPADWFAAAPDCTAHDYLAKYFNYRRRFRGDGTARFPGFTAIGLGPGRMLPAGTRNPDADCPTHWLTHDCRQETIPGARGNYHYGDSTIWLGLYLAVLGTEHKAFSTLGIDTAETERDIYYALQAFNRLDEVAEVYFGVPPRLDGFFKRDDVPVEFIWKDSSKTQLRFPRDDGFIGYQCISSGTTCGTVTTRDGYFMSQDQVIYLLAGFAAVAKLVPPGVEVEGVRLSHEARAITHRIVKFLRDRSWKIVDPNGESPPNQWGGTALPFSNEIAKAANFITDNAFGISDYRDALSMSAGAALMAAVDASWDVQSQINQGLAFTLAVVTDVWSQEKLARRAADWSAPYYPLLNMLLHGHGFPPNVSEAEIQGQLSSAPCAGPCNGPADCTPVPGWMGEHRYADPDDRGGDNKGLRGHFNGLDYMAMHNLYVVAKAGKTQLDWDPAPRCRRPGTLALWMQSPPTPGMTYDPWDDCNRPDFSVPLCGRPFAAWLDGAYHGREVIHFAGGVRLLCEGFLPCRVVPSAGGTEKDDLFIGSPGADTFEGAGGQDCLMGYGGDDRLEGNAGRDEIHGGTGNDVLCGENCNFTDVSGDPDQLYGDEGEDDLQGGPASDVLFGGADADRLDGGGGFDFLFGEGGNDLLYGELGEDQLSGGPGDDTLYGGLGGDTLWGNEGRDKLDGGMGDDVLVGGPGPDFLMGGEGADRLWGEEGNDRLCGGCGEDQLDGGWNDLWTDPQYDQCRGEGSFCLTTTSNSLVWCEASATANECKDSAFDAW